MLFQAKTPEIFIQPYGFRSFLNSSRIRRQKKKKVSLYNRDYEDTLKLNKLIDTLLVLKSGSYFMPLHEIGLSAFLCPGLRTLHIM